MDTLTVHALATEFEIGLRAALAPEDYAAVVETNATEAGAACASHDYIDSNETMSAAFLAVVGRPADPASAADATMIDAAWDHWRTRATEALGSSYFGTDYR